MNQTEHFFPILAIEARKELKARLIERRRAMNDAIRLLDAAMTQLPAQMRAVKSKAELRAVVDQVESQFLRS
jgi:prefoldin subunit 5